MADTVNAETRLSNVAYVLAKLRVRGVDHLLLRAHKKWGDWSLVGGHVEPTDSGFFEAAKREVDEEMAPLRCGNDVEVQALALPVCEWGPVNSVSAGGAPTRYRAQWYVLRFKQSPGVLLGKLPQDEFLLIPFSELARFKPLSSVVDKVSHELSHWQKLPLSWELDLDQAPLRVPTGSQAARNSRP